MHCKVLDPLSHDTKVYYPGDMVELPDETAKHLAAIKVVEIMPAPPKTTKPKAA